MSAIEIKDLCKAYGSIQALDGLTLDVEEGSVFGFLGPNGAGKTTTISLLTGLVQPSSGSARVAGVDIRDRKGLVRQIGYLPEDPAFYGWMTPREFLDYAGRLFGMGPAERSRRVTELLELAGLAEAAKRRIRGFSRGMRQRLGLAQALINQPPVLLLDEPASALDPAGRRDILELIAGLRGSCTVFMSTHILSDVERVCDTVGILNRGRLVTRARQDDLLAGYAGRTFLLEAEHGPLFQEWLESLRNAPWFSSLEMENSTARLGVKDLDAARQDLLSGAAEKRIPLRRFEILMPTLEDVFLHLTGGEEK